MFVEFDYFSLSAYVRGEIELDMLPVVTEGEGLVGGTLHTEGNEVVIGEDRFPVGQAFKHLFSVYVPLTLARELPNRKVYVLVRPEDNCRIISMTFREALLGTFKEWKADHIRLLEGDIVVTNKDQEHIPSFEAGFAFSEEAAQRMLRTVNEEIQLTKNTLLSTKEALLNTESSQEVLRVLLDILHSGKGAKTKDLDYLSNSKEEAVLVLREALYESLKEHLPIILEDIKKAAYSKM